MFYAIINQSKFYVSRYQDSIPALFRGGSDKEQIMIENGQERSPVAEVEKFSFQTDSRFTTESPNKELSAEISDRETAAIEKRDFTVVFARMKKSARKKSAGIF